MRRLLSVRHLSTPFLLITPEDVRKNIIALRRDARKVSLFYAVKANSDPRIINTIDEMQVGFEISSPGEAIALWIMEFHLNGLSAFIQ
ncbi:MAG: hypothetical protein U0Z53_07865 [Blastocatellia bacterium]